MSGTTVVLADDQPAMRASLRPVLESSGFVVCGEAVGARDAVSLVESSRAEICLLEVLLPGGGIVAAREIAAQSPATVVIMLTASRERDDLIEAIRAGARGYLLKDMNPERLPLAIRGVLAGEAAIPRSLVASLVGELHSQGLRRAMVGKNGQVDLSRREWEVLELLAQGSSTAEIAERLFLSPVTVRRHISSVVGKLGVEDRDEAAGMLADMLSAPPRQGD